MPRIKNTVGRKSHNDPFDVAVVQKLLKAAATNRRAASLDPKRTDGHFDAATAVAITAFELEVMSLPKSDGRLQMDDKTWKLLLREAGEIDANPDGWPVQPPGVHALADDRRDVIFSTFVTNPGDKVYPGYVDDPGTDAADKDNIRILGGWEGKNIQKAALPQLAKIGKSRKPSTRFHYLAIPQLQGLWQAWEDAGLLGRVQTFDGGFVARYKRKKPHTTPKNLSNHSWGTAFDINAATNGLGKTPAIIWEDGCVFELVKLAVQWGFFWGGWFGQGRVDGMHFEVRVVTNKPLDL